MEKKGGVAVTVPLAIGVASLQDVIMVTIYGLLRSLIGDMKCNFHIDIWITNV